MKDHPAVPPFGMGRRKSYRHAAATPEVQSITNAAAAHSDEMHSRFVKYALAMGIRMVCIGLIFVFDDWFKLVPVVGAVVLPWVAVVIANGGSDVNKAEATTLLDEAPPFELADGESFGTDYDEHARDGILKGEVIDTADEGPDANPETPEAPDGES